MRMRIKDIFKHKKLILFVLIVLAVVFVPGMLSKKQNTIQSTTVSRGSIKEDLSLSGSVDADEHIGLSFPTAGRLAYVGIKEGDKVRKYQTVASLDVRQMQKTLEKYLNNFQSTFNTFDQTHDDNQDKVLTDAVRRVLGNSQNTLNNSVLDVEIQNIAIELSRLVSPIEGIATRVDFPYAGINVGPTQQIEIINPKTIFFSVTADQTEVVNLKEGTEAEITLDSFPDKKIVGKIKSISFTPKAGETSTVYEVKITLENLPDLNYRMGMTGDALFVTQEKSDVLFVPTIYVKSDSKGSYVVSGSSKKKIYVTTGIESTSSTQISGDIREGETVYDTTIQ